MPSFRALTVLLAGALLASTTAAGASPSPAPGGCPLVTDAAGDATGTGPVGVPLPSNPNLDVRGADLDTRGGTVTAVIRLAELGVVDPLAPSGRTYYLNFDAQGAALYLSASLQATGEVVYRAGVVDGARRTLSVVTGTLDPARAEVRIAAPYAAFKLHARRFRAGQQLKRVEVLTQRLISTPRIGLTLTADSATTQRVHVVGSRGCVVPA